jgi:hypothetical protein
VKAQDPWEVATGDAGRPWARHGAWGTSRPRVVDPGGGAREGPWASPLCWGARRCRGRVAWDPPERKGKGLAPPVGRRPGSHRGRGAWAPPVAMLRVRK